MKKIFTAALVGLMLVSTACASNRPANTNFDYKVGAAAYTHTNDSYGYKEGINGRGAVSTTMVSAVFDNSGKIVKVYIDEVESKIGIDNFGQLADFTPGEVLSKKELGGAYGMKAASSIGKEWHQQVEHLEKWLEGKDITDIIGTGKAAVSSMMTNSRSINPVTSDDMAGISAPTSDATNSVNSTNSGSGIVNDVISGANSVIDNLTDGGENLTGTTANKMWMDEDLKAGVTIDTTYIQRAIEKAYRNAK